MIYADYDYYANVFMGNAIAEDDFPRMAARASRYIDYITRNKAERNANLPGVKDCCCALAEQYQMIDASEQLALQSVKAGSADTAEVQSESVGSWSRSYRSGGDSAQSAAQAAAEGRSVLLDTARMYLTNTGLLYRGGGCRV